MSIRDQSRRIERLERFFAEECKSAVQRKATQSVRTIEDRCDDYFNGMLLISVGYELLSKALAVGDDEMNGAH